MILQDEFEIRNWEKKLRHKINHVGDLMPPSERIVSVVDEAEVEWKLQKDMYIKAKHEEFYRLKQKINFHGLELRFRGWMNFPKLSKCYSTFKLPDFSSKNTEEIPNISADEKELSEKDLSGTDSVNFPKRSSSAVMLPKGKGKKGAKKAISETTSLPRPKPAIGGQAGNFMRELNNFGAVGARREKANYEQNCVRRGDTNPLFYDEDKESTKILKLFPLFSESDVVNALKMPWSKANAGNSDENFEQLQDGVLQKTRYPKKSLMEIELSRNDDVDDTEHFSKNANNSGLSENEKLSMSLYSDSFLVCAEVADKFEVLNEKATEVNISNKANSREWLHLLFDPDLALDPFLHRTCALNLHAISTHGTVEFRRFQSTLDPELVADWSRLCAMFVDAALLDYGDNKQLCGKDVRNCEDILTRTFFPGKLLNMLNDKPALGRPWAGTSNSVPENISLQECKDRPNIVELRRAQTLRDVHEAMATNVKNCANADNSEYRRDSSDYSSFTSSGLLDKFKKEQESATVEELVQFLTRGENGAKERCVRGLLHRIKAKSIGQSPSIDFDIEGTSLLSNSRNGVSARWKSDNRSNLVGTLGVSAASLQSSDIASKVVGNKAKEDNAYTAFRMQNMQNSVLSQLGQTSIQNFLKAGGKVMVGGAGGNSNPPQRDSKPRDSLSDSPEQQPRESKEERL